MFVNLHPQKLRLLELAMAFVASMLSYAIYILRNDVADGECLADPIGSFTELFIPPFSSLFLNAPLSPARQLSLQDVTLSHKFCLTLVLLCCFTSKDVFHFVDTGRSEPTVGRPFPNCYQRSVALGNFWCASTAILSTRQCTLASPLLARFSRE